ncbi:AAA family ATPase [bacterium]|nr:AAA family ATPase [bacterium]
MRKIAVINQKGGSGKTTTVVNLGACLARKGNKVLLIDMDPQSHTTIHLGFEPPNIKGSVYDVLIKRTPVQDVLVETYVKNLFILPSKIELASAEIELVNEIGREIILRDMLKKHKQNFDYLLIDCPPSVGLLTLNALTTVNEIFIPIQAEFFALEGLTKLLQTIEIIQDRLNSNLKITGIIVTMFDSRKNICKDVASKIKGHFGKKMFTTKIRDNVKLAEAPSYGKSVIDFAQGSYGAEDYMNLASEVVKQGGKK